MSSSLVVKNSPFKILFLSSQTYQGIFADFKQYDTTSLCRCGTFQVPHFFRLVAEGYESFKNEDTRDWTSPVEFGKKMLDLVQIASDEIHLV
jgi:hypothetical protein